MIRNIVFDMGNVLIHFAPEPFIRKLTDDETAAEAVLRELFGGPEWRLLDAGKIEKEEAVRRICERIPEYETLLRLALSRWAECLSPIPGMEKLVKRLKEQKLGLYLLSNTSMDFFRFSKRFEALRYFDGFLISAQEKLLKPDRAIYRLLCSRFELRPSECLFIDDLQENIDAAVSLGFSGHRFGGAQELESFLLQGGLLQRGLCEGE